MHKVLFICLGNICRSPLAEGIFNNLISNQNLQNNFLVDSCGTSGSYHEGEKPDPRSIKVAHDNNIKLNHLARQLTVKDLSDFDLLTVMDKENLLNVQNLLHKHNLSIHKTNLLLENTDLLNKEVPDPYYGDQKGFEKVYELIQIGCEKLLVDLTI